MAGSNADVKALSIPEVAIDPETKQVRLVPGNVPGLTDEQSKNAYDTRLHSLRMMEALILSGEMNISEMMAGLEKLAKYQFKPAATRKGPETNETPIEQLRGLVDGEDE